MTAVIERPSPAAPVSEGLRSQEQSIVQPPIPENPSLKLMNTRVWMRQLSEKYGQPITLGTIPDQELDALAKDHDAVWCMGIYKPSEASRRHAKKWSFQYDHAIPGFNAEEDVVGSPFAIPGDELNPKIAKDWDEWDEFRERMHERGVRVGVDFVPNHVAIDHPWTKTKPHYFWRGSQIDIDLYGNQFFKVPQPDGAVQVYAHGKDPNFGEWHDTAQLNYANPELQQTQIDRLRFLSQHADLIRCDVAMLVDKDTFVRSWGWRMWPGDHENIVKMGEFWERAIGTVKAEAARNGRTIEFMAEAYWDEEFLGKHFDYIYDKTTYDRMRDVVHGQQRTRELLPHLEHLYRKEAQHKPVLFTENHDEPREDEAFGQAGARAAAIVAALTPGMYLHHHGQENGGVFKTPMTTDRIPSSEMNGEKVSFYDRVFAIRNSELAKQGHQWLHIAKNPDGSVADMVAQQFHHQDRGVIVCTNLQDAQVSGNIYIRPGAEIHVVDMMSGEEIVDHGFTPAQDGAPISLKRYGSKAIFYQYPEGFLKDETF